MVVLILGYALKSATHSLTELFLIFQNKHGTIKRREDRTVVPSSHCIILKSVGFYVSGQCSKQDLCGCPKPAEAKKKYNWNRRPWVTSKFIKSLQSSKVAKCVFTT